MDLRQLEIFLEVARRLNFTRAAQSLGIAQPAVSQMIARLEAELGMELFDRRKREVRLTEAGARLVPLAERVRGDVAAALHEMAKLRGLAAGRINVGVTPTVATHLLPRILAAYRERVPDVEVVLREGGAGALATMLARGAVDLAILVMPVEQPGIMTDPLFTEDLLLAVAEGSAIAQLAERGPVDLRVAADQPFILYRASYHLRSATLKGCHAAGFEPHIALEGGEMETVLRMVAAGLGVSLVPMLAFEGSPRPGVIGVRISTPSPTRTLALARREDRRLSPAADAFAQVVRTVVQVMNPPTSA